MDFRQQRLAQARTARLMQERELETQEAELNLRRREIALKDAEIRLRDAEAESKKADLREHNKPLWRYRPFLTALITSLAAIVITFFATNTERTALRSQLEAQKAHFETQKQTWEASNSDLRNRRDRLESDIGIANATATSLRESLSEAKQAIALQKIQSEKLISDEHTLSARREEELANALRAVYSVVNNGTEEFWKTRRDYEAEMRKMTQAGMLAPNGNDDPISYCLKSGFFHMTGAELSARNAAVKHITTCAQLLSRRTDGAIEIIQNALIKRGELHPIPSFGSPQTVEPRIIPKALPVEPAAVP